MRVDVLLRMKMTTPQAEKKDRTERLQNMKSVFSVSSHGVVSQYKNVLLFDDVFTTGATTRAAAGVLKRHGVQFVWGVTMAR
jgi:predicted amidophosphoribosyltransferase